MSNAILRLIPWTSAALVLGLGVLLGSCSRHETVQASSLKDSDIQTVAVAKVQAANLAHNLVLTAEFKPFQEIDVMAKVAGYIKEINVDVGDHVAKNQLLATLEIPEMADDLRRANSSVKRSQAEVQRAEDELQRAESAHNIAHLSFQ